MALMANPVMQLAAALNPARKTKRVAHHMRNLHHDMQVAGGGRHHHALGGGLAEQMSGELDRRHDLQHDIGVASGAHESPLEQLLAALGGGGVTPGTHFGPDGGPSHYPPPHVPADVSNGFRAPQPHPGPFGSPEQFEFGGGQPDRGGIMTPGAPHEWPHPGLPTAGIHYFGPGGGGGVAYPSGGPSGPLQGSRGFGYMEPIRRRPALSQAFQAA